MTELLAAFGSVDDVTAAFLLEALSNADAQDWDPLLEPFIRDTSAALAVLASDGKAVENATAIVKARTSCNLQPLVEPRGTFKRATRIEGAQNRAISLRQLRQVLAFIEENADEHGNLPWIDRDERSPTFDRRLHVNAINLYHVVDWVVKPITEEAACSLVEMMATGPQRPRWFVSHAWAEPVRDFVTALEKHAQVRDLSQDDYWWVCGYANNQHNINIDIDPDPKRTSFYLAMQQCEGVLLCLDHICTPFTRIWCCFEEAMIIQGKNTLLLDIVTVVDGEAVVLTDGFVQEDLRDGERFALELKRDRESGFPLKLLERGYSIDIRNADSSQEDDKRRILNTIAGNIPPEELGRHEPDLLHPSFSTVNRALRGIFAEAATRKAAEAGRLNPLIEVLRQDVDRRSLTLNLGGCDNVDVPVIANLAGHPSLEKLVIDLCYSSVSDVSGVGEAISGLPRLTDLRLNFTWCNALHDISPLSKGFAPLTSLIDLTIDCRWCGFAVPVTGIEKLQSLERLSIDSSFTRTQGTKALLLEISHLEKLRVLTLRFKGCTQLAHARKFGILVRLQMLQTLTLDFAYSCLTQIYGLRCLGDLPQLSQCQLYFSKCIHLEGVSWISQLCHISEIELDFSGCKRLESSLQRRFQKWGEISKVLHGVEESTSQSLRFFVGNHVEYFSSGQKSWLPAEVVGVDTDSVKVKVLDRRWDPRPIPLFMIPKKLRDPRTSWKGKWGERKERSRSKSVDSF